MKLWKPAAFTLIACSSLSIILPPGEAEPPYRGEEAKTNLPHRAGSSQTNFDDYLWPTDAGNIVTSTFAEYRRSHFHGGIDISTGNRTGYRVFASRDGYVSRIRISPVGYGKMLYLRHPDGYYTTYAHLSGFRADMQELVAGEQHFSSQYPVDIRFLPDEFPVKKGDVIAYTGETGVGSPHLHFEIRNEREDFVNPLASRNFTFHDRIRPTFRRIAVTPLGESSTVDGTEGPKTYTVRKVSSASFTIRKPIRLTGEAGLSIDIIDRAEGSRFRHGAYSHQLIINDGIIFSVRLDRAPSVNSHHSGLYYDWDLIEQGRGRFQHLFMNTPNDLHFYSPAKDTAGVIRSSDYPEGPHRFTVVSTDAAGNEAKLTGTFIMNHPPTFGVIRNGTAWEIIHLHNVEKLHIYSRRSDLSKWNVKTLTRKSLDGGPLRLPLDDREIHKIVAENKWGTRSHPKIIAPGKTDKRAASLALSHEVTADFVRVDVKTQGIFTTPPILTLYEADAYRNIALEAVDIDHYAGKFRPAETVSGRRRLVAEAVANGHAVTAIDEFDIYPITRGKPGTLILDNGNLILTHDSSSVLKTVYMQIEKEEDNDGVTYTLNPRHTVLDQGFTVAIRAGSESRPRGLFFKARGSLEVLDAGTNGASGILSGRITQTLGELSVAVDSSPPSISKLRISSSRNPLITFRFRDNFSGVEYDELKMYIDGIPVIPEIDGEHHRASCQITDPLDRGPHFLAIRLKDKLGNTTEVEHRFTTK